MITYDMLERWRLAKNAAIINEKLDIEVTTIIQEMYIECKELRQDNFKLLDQNELLDAALLFIESIRINNYLSAEQEEAYDSLYNRTSEQNLEQLNER